mgnify:CR=1 FL=1
MGRSTRIAILILMLLLATLGVGFAWAGNSDHTDVYWQVLSGGGAPAVSGSGRVVLDGSLGQTAIGPAAGGGYGLGAGYWYGQGQGGYPVYLPLLLRNR